LEVLQPDLIESTGKLTLDDALQKVPGVTVIDGQANIRGGSGYSQGAGSRVLLLVDDVPILQADAGFPNWDDVPIEIIEQVEVVKGAASALYGSSALNGIINVRTAYARNEPETRGSVYYTSYLPPERKELQWWDSAPRTFGGSVSHRQRFGDFDVILGGFYINEESFREDVFRRYGRANFNVRHRATDRLSYGLAGNLNVGKTASYFYWAGLDNAYSGDTSTYSNRERFRYNLDPSLLFYDNAGNRHRFLGRFYHVNNENDRDQGNKSDLYYGEYQFQRRISSAELVLTAGVVGMGTAVDAELYGDTTFTSRNFAGYVQLDKTFFDRLNASVGFRYEYNVLHNPGFTYPQGVVEPRDEEESRPVLRVGLNYQVAEGTYLRASWGQGYRYPTLAEKYIYTNAGGFFIQPSPDLGSETGWSAEIGIKQGYQLGQGAFEGFLDVAAFYMAYQDMIEFNWTGTGFQSLNIGGTEISGLEVTLAGRGSIGPLPFQLLAGYSYIDPRFASFDPDAEPGSPAQLNAQNSSSDENVLKYRFRHNFKFDGQLSWGKFRLGAESFYISRIEAVDKLFSIIVPGLQAFQELHPEGFWYHNFRLAYQHDEHWKATFILGNAFNAEYTIRPALLEAPRNLTFRIDFDF
ncbi:MAG: TonB-dependent receptor, partial [Lewinella sp.]|nr:TonB-dependent receptor [Lewinella sp.]